MARSLSSWGYLVGMGFIIPSVGFGWKVWTKPRTYHQALKIALLYLRHNITEELLSDIFETSQATISRTIHRIEKALLKLEELKTPGLESLKNIPGSLVVDGTLISVKELGFTRGEHCFRTNTNAPDSITKSSAL